MIHTKKVMMDRDTGMYYCGTYSGQIYWDKDIDMANNIRDIDGINVHLYPWEIDELSEMSLEVKEIVEYIENE